MSHWHKFRTSRFGRFLRRYWWAYPAFLVVKWGTIGALGYTALSVSGEEHLGREQAGAGEGWNLGPGDKLPAFQLPAWEPGAQAPVLFDSAALCGKEAFLLYFYPLDDTPG
jgi:hypothetical protein